MAFLASNPAPSISEGSEVLVQLVMAAMTTEPFESSKLSPLFFTATFFCAVPSSDFFERYFRLPQRHSLIALYGAGRLRYRRSARRDAREYRILYVRKARLILDRRSRPYRTKRRPLPLRQSKVSFEKSPKALRKKKVAVKNQWRQFELSNGSVVIAAIPVAPYT